MFLKGLVSLNTKNVIYKEILKKMVMYIQVGTSTNPVLWLKISNHMQIQMIQEMEMFVGRENTYILRLTPRQVRWLRNVMTVELPHPVKKI